jgi:dipeptidase E
VKEMIRYYCSGFDINNAFGHGLGKMLKNELTNKKSIVYIPGGPEKIEKAKTKYIPSFTNHFKNVGIEFATINLITPNMDINTAKNMIDNASFIMLMGGDPFNQKKMCSKLDILSNLKNYKGLMLGFSAGAMFMSKYMIITPCSEQYPDFKIGQGLNFDEISIYPHNNTSEEIYPDSLNIGNETYKKDDLIKVAKQCGEFYLLQDNLNKNGTYDISIIKSDNGKIEFYKENDGKIWIVNNSAILQKKGSIKKI